jgi:glycosyltransferase involved in cell wall biosynthesis
MTADMRFSVVIPTHNRKDTLRRCLATATGQVYPDYEVIVVDDGSTDGTGDMVQREFPQVRYIRQDPNRGPAVARNRGIEVADGEIIAFTDDDCLLPLDFLSRLAEGYQRYPEVAGVGGYL